MKILILCTGNSCRSQMTEGFLQSFDPNIKVYSAGTDPSDKVHPKAITVMNEIGINLSTHYPKLVDEFLDEKIDYVITVCDNAKENCPVFIGDVKQRLHIGFEDPAEARGTEQEIYAVFRNIRDEIRDRMHEFYMERIKN